MKVFDVGDAIYVFDEIAYVSKSKGTNIKIFLKGNPAEFVLSFNSEKERDTMYDRLRKEITDS